MGYSVWLAVPILAAVALIGPKAEAAAPGAGVYEAEGLYTAVSAGGGAICPAVGSTFNFAFSYPGPGKTGASAHAGSLKNGNFEVGSITFSKTPAAGLNHWNGTAITRTSSSKAENKAIFQGVLKFFDSSSFLATFQWQETEASGGTCDETIEFTFVKA